MVEANRSEGADVLGSHPAFEIVPLLCRGCPKSTEFVSRKDAKPYVSDMILKLLGGFAPLRETFWTA